MARLPCEIRERRFKREHSGGVDVPLGGGRIDGIPIEEVIESCLLSGDMKYINILPANQLLPPKTMVWDVTNKKSGELLGRIKYYANWRQYCFFPATCTVFSAGCLAEITGFIEAHKKDRRGPHKDVVEER